MPDDTCRGDVVPQHQAPTQSDQGSHLLFIRYRGSLFAFGIVATVEIANYRNSKVRIVAFGVRSLAAFRSSGLNVAVGKDQVMIGDMVNMTGTGDFKSASRVILVNRAFVFRRCIFIRKHCGVVNHNAGGDDRVEERCQR